MKSKLSFLLLILLSHFSFSQKLIFHGYVDSNFASDTIYYSINKMDFSDKNFILLNKHTYTLELDLKKNKKSKTLYFSNSLWNFETPEEKEDCVHKYNLIEILKYFKNQSNDITIESDVIKSFNCGIWEVSFSPSENTEFEGKYELIINGEKRNTEINSMFAQSTLEKINKKLMTSESSNWAYNPNEKKLKFTRIRQFNPTLGLELMIDDVYTFDVIDINGVITFNSQSENYQLRKL